MSNISEWPKKISEWRNAQRVHSELIRQSKELCAGFIDIKANHGVDFLLLGDEWQKARIHELYADLLDFSRKKVLRLAREALKEVETVKADAMLDIESIEEDEKC